MKNGEKRNRQAGASCTYLNLTKGSLMLQSISGGRFLASTSTIVTTELHIWDLSLLEASANRGCRWKY